ncbi:unnamed protein product [Sphagnum jensenii]|uniref:Uncharacterized protein n=1 Tax=Sphagnum jensenii TaxID=128206 RepID=A0ABP0WRW6_9BRYO
MVRKSQVNKSDETLLRPKARRHPKWTSLHAPQVFTGTERPWDLHIDSTTMTVLAMDGRHRWLDIEKLVKGDDRFVLVTNLAPRVGVHVHLGMEKAQ